MKESHKLKFKKIVELLATFSDNERLKVGAIILKNGRIISTGYNGQLPGASNRLMLVNGHDISTIHAEQNAILHCAKLGIATEDCTLLTSHFPCSICTKLAIMAGIKEIYYVNDYKNNENHFRFKIDMVKL